MSKTAENKKILSNNKYVKTIGERQMKLSGLNCRKAVKNFSTLVFKILNFTKKVDVTVLK